jgi:tetratricopeptide (TPR) repeat protein
LVGNAEQLRYLAQLYLQQGLPYKAGRLLEGEIARHMLKPDRATQLLVAQAWQTAREPGKAIGVLETTLAASPDPDAYGRLAQLYFSREAWDDAARVLQEGIRVAAEKQRGRLWMRLGVVRYRQGYSEQARAAFEQARRGTETRDQAEQWIRYLDYLETADF